MPLSWRYQKNITSCYERCPAQESQGGKGMTKNDPEQQLAIDTVGTNILVSASAGAGKTRVLVARLTKRIVKDHIRLSSILALTFTDAAAQEMKKRLSDSLHEEYEKETDTEQKDWLYSQIIELEAASITTIDSWCTSVLKKYISVIGLDPAMTDNILSSGNEQILLDASFHDAYAELCSKEPDTALKLAEYFSGRSEDYEELKKAVGKINDHALSSMNPEKWYREAETSYTPASSLSSMNKDVLDRFYSHLSIGLERDESLVRKAQSLIGEDSKAKPEGYLPKFAAIANCRNAVKERSYSSYCTFLDSLVLTATPADTKNLEYTKARKAFTDLEKKMLSERYPEELLVQDHNEMNQVCTALVQLSRSTYLNYMRKKQAQKAMDFSDMERYTYDVLRANDHAVADIIRDSLQEITIDEFQDTSELQNEIIDLIARKDNVFRVGDIKQSIYKFRQAKPSLMRSLMKDPDTMQITLRHNFRSMQSIVDFSNHLFSRLMNIDGMENVYSEQDTVSIGREDQKEAEPVPAVFALLQTDSAGTETDTDSTDEAEEESYSSKEMKAGWIAETIMDIKKKDPSLSFHSFAILLRSHQDKRYLRSAFDQRGIPYHIDMREGFYRSDLCLSVLSFVSLMIAPDDSISLASVLTSGMYRFTDEQLSAVAAASSSLVKGIHDTRPDIYEDIEALHHTADLYGCAAMLKELSLKHDYYNSLNSAQKANFDYLYENACRWNCASLADFMEILQAGQDETSSEASSRGKDDDVVEVTTIHQSKGLQYPIVFLWSSSQNCFQDRKNAVEIDQDLHIGLFHLSLPYREKRETVQRIAVDQKSDTEDIEEFIRILYVAVTRAEKRLFIVDTEPKNFTYQDVDQGLLSSRKGMTSLILNAMKDDPLLKVIHCTSIGVTAADSTDKKYANTLPSLSIHPKIIKPITTPSETEMSSIFPIDRNTSVSGTGYGTCMHETAELLPNRIWTMEDLKAYDLKDNDKKKLISFSESDLYQKALTMEIHKEFPFYVETDTERLTGTMDFCAVNDHEVLLIDYKTDNASAEEIRKRYSSQLNTYRKALEHLYPDHTIAVYAWSFHNDEPILIKP
jgi:ATP-dependent helicase/nuclease subunit A